MYGSRQACLKLMIVIFSDVATSPGEALPSSVSFQVRRCWTRRTLDYFHFPYLPSPFLNASNVESLLHIHYDQHNGSPFPFPFFLAPFFFFLSELGLGEFGRVLANMLDSDFCIRINMDVNGTIQKDFRPISLVVMLGPFASINLSSPGDG